MRCHWGNLHLGCKFTTRQGKKSIPASFLINIMLYTLAIVFRAFSEVFKDEIQSSVKIIITSICLSLIEFPFAYFIFEIRKFKS